MSTTGKGKRPSSQSGKGEKRKSATPNLNPSPSKFAKQKKKDSNKRPGQILLSITSTQGGHWLIKGDGFMNTMAKGIEQDEDFYNPFKYFGKMYEKHSFGVDSPKCNAKGFWNYWLMRQITDDIPDTFESRMEHLETIADYLNQHPSNIYNNRYVVDRETADETPDELKALDHYVITSNIVEYIKTIHDIELEDNTWARTNNIEKDYYFTGPTYPFQAKRVLGYSDLS